MPTKYEKVRDPETGHTTIVNKAADSKAPKAKAEKPKKLEAETKAE